MISQYNQVQEKRLVSADYLKSLEQFNKQAREQIEALRREVQALRLLAEAAVNTDVPVRIVEDESWKSDMDRIVGICARGYNVPPSSVMGRCKSGSTAWARQHAMAIIRRQTKLTITEIGKYFGRDHSTVIHACNAIDRRKTWKEESDRIERIEKECQQSAIQREHLTAHSLLPVGRTAQKLDSRNAMTPAAAISAHP